MTNRRLFVFDIDATLISSGGAGAAAMRRAFAALWRADEGFQNVEFSGRSDRHIFNSAYRLCGLGDDLSPEDFRRAKQAYLRRLDGSLAEFRSEGRVLPGVVPLLEKLSREESVTLTLGTGNFRNGALRKLRCYGLDGYFLRDGDAYFRSGGFGDRLEDRALLVAEAVRSAERLAGKHDQVYVIGDTVHDITAAKANNLIAVGVTTGSTNEAELKQAGADIVLPTLKSAEKHLT